MTRFILIKKQQQQKNVVIFGTVHQAIKHTPGWTFKYRQSKFSRRYRNCRNIITIVMYLYTQKHIFSIEDVLFDISHFVTYSHARTGSAVTLIPTVYYGPNMPTVNI